MCKEETCTHYLQNCFATNQSTALYVMCMSAPPCLGKNFRYQLHKVSLLVSVRKTMSMCMAVSDDNVGIIIIYRWYGILYIKFMQLTF
jgi:hypothetical protein